MMEPERPKVDRSILEFVKSHKFHERNAWRGLFVNSFAVGYRATVGPQEQSRHVRLACNCQPI
jgi:hypothetical protein